MPNFLRQAADKPPPSLSLHLCKFPPHADWLHAQAVHGGESASGDLLDDLWFFHPASASWKKDGDTSTSQAAAAGPRPCPRSSHCLAHAESSGEGSADGSSSLVLFGGLGYTERDGGGVVEEEEEEDTMPLNDLWVWSPATTAGTPAAAAAAAMSDDMGGAESIIWSGDGGGGGGVWSLVVLDGVGPSPRSLAAIVSAPRRHNGVADLFLFGGYGLVELGRPVDDGAPEEQEEDDEEGGEIIMAYIDDLWRLTLGSGGAGIASGTASTGGVAPAVPLRWDNEAEMGFAGESIVEGRNGHTLTWCGEKLVLFGGFVGDGFDAGVHVAEPPSSPSTSLD